MLTGVSRLSAEAGGEAPGEGESGMKPTWDPTLRMLVWATGISLGFYGLVGLAFWLCTLT